ncbi:MAG: hypothetical protein J6S85_15435 [Methanobrevibacter sp.]|nr:hypothetical protein [Methanobrevibacter sp.]MBO7714960.1 hypothetical protein [Methanobrevibacter sp.]
MNRPSPDDLNDIIMAEQREKIKELEKENKLLKARNEELNENCYGLAKENKELKKKLDILYHYV